MTNEYDFDRAWLKQFHIDLGGLSSDTADTGVNERVAPAFYDEEAFLLRMDKALDMAHEAIRELERQRDKWRRIARVAWGFSMAAFAVILWGVVAALLWGGR